MQPLTQPREKKTNLKAGWLVLGGFVLGGLISFMVCVYWVRTGHQIVFSGEPYWQAREKEQDENRDRIEERNRQLAYLATQLRDEELQLRHRKESVEKLALSVEQKLKVIEEFKKKNDTGLGRTWASMNPEDAGRIMDNMADDSLLGILLGMDAYHRGKILGCYAARQDVGQEANYYAKRAARLTDQLMAALESKINEAPGKSIQSP